MLEKLLSVQIFSAHLACFKVDFEPSRATFSRFQPGNPPAPQTKHRCNGGRPRTRMDSTLGLNTGLVRVPYVHTGAARMDRHSGLCARIVDLDTEGCAERLRILMGVVLGPNNKDDFVSVQRHEYPTWRCCEPRTGENTGKTVPQSAFPKCSPLPSGDWCTRCTYWCTLYATANAANPKVEKCLGPKKRLAMRAAPLRFFSEQFSSLCTHRAT